MALGFIGTGEITKAVVIGLSTVAGDKPDIILSPRNGQIAGELAARFANVTVAASNQAVIDAADMLFLALRPLGAGEILKTLTFRAGQHVVSFMATYDVAAIRALVAPADTVTLVTPLPAVAFHGGPTPIYPPDDEIVAMFSPLGTAVAVETPEEYQALCVATSTLAGAFAYYETIADWLEAKNVPADKARAFSGAVFYALAATAKNAPHLNFSELTLESATKGGTNEQVVKLLKERGVYNALNDGMDAIWERFENAKK
ncbi:pyrroline-5-carboxylate reductase [Martelella sp. HB161492]|uniref:pyrroline-5-carboxylate reductase n=1 Tax=Martelella sp. HB161492 TaxID=2720726 RepID=UPI001590F0E3|nr:pyrroline-5-carboxylate reductase [Martelella sp. HB161492]